MPFNPNRINIHELTIEEPEKPSELPFDPERDITEEDWKEMKRSIEKNVSEGQFDLFSGKAREMKLLFPERVDELHLTDEVWEGIKYHLDGVIDLGMIPKWTADLKILFPDRFSEINLSPLIWGEVIKCIKNWCILVVENKNTLLLASGEQIINAKIVDPGNKELNKITKNAELRKIMISVALEKKQEKAWWAFISLCAIIKIIFPETINKILDNETWNQLRAFVDSADFREESVCNRGYENLKILAAEEIEFTDNGMEFVMPKEKKSLQTKTPPLPETKKF